MFTEDIDLLPKNFFPQFLQNTRCNSRDFAEALRQFFRAMQHGGMFGAERVLHFNGGLFDDVHALQLDTEGMDILGVLKTRTGELDLDYLKKWGQELKIADLLERAVKKAI